MGDRSNIVIEDRGRRVYLYGHWMGPSSIDHAVHGLSSGRVGDAGYLARIIFSSMTRGQEDAETGFGISATMLDNEYPLIVIDGDAAAGRVWLELESGESITEPVTAAQFIAAVRRATGAPPLEDADTDRDEYGEEFGALVKALRWENTEEHA